MAMRRKILMAAVALAAWIAEDLYVPRHHDLRSFDPERVAVLETGMWRSYYEHRALALFTELTQLLRQEYGMPFWRSALAGFHAAKAAEVFQRGHNRAEYEHALPDLVAYYDLVLRTSASSFDVEAVSRLELEWWIVHRERDRHPPGALEASLAALQSAIYHVPAERFRDHAQARAEAMAVRDTKADAPDWARIDGLLARSWSALHAEVNR